MKVIVLGAGLVGGPMAADLSVEDRFQVTVADIDQGALDSLAAKAKITPLLKDLSQPEAVTDLVKAYDFAIDANSA